MREGGGGGLSLVLSEKVNGHQVRDVVVPRARKLFRVTRSLASSFVIFLFHHVFFYSVCFLLFFLAPVRFVRSLFLFDLSSEIPTNRFSLSLSLFIWSRFVTCAFPRSKIFIITTESYASPALPAN